MAGVWAGAEAAVGGRAGLAEREAVACSVGWAAAAYLAELADGMEGRVGRRAAYAER